MALSLIAIFNDKPIGHILFSPVSIENNPQQHVVWAIAPLAVLPEFQRQGVGKQLMKESLEQCKTQNVSAIVLLGHTSYYPIFGFEAASHYDLFFKGEDFGDAFMVKELRQGVLPSMSGTVNYAPAFD